MVLRIEAIQSREITYGRTTFFRAKGRRQRPIHHQRERQRARAKSCEKIRHVSRPSSASKIASASAYQSTTLTDTSTCPPQSCFFARTGAHASAIFFSCARKTVTSDHARRETPARSVCRPACPFGRMHGKPSHTEGHFGNAYVALAAFDAAQRSQSGLLQLTACRRERRRSAPRRPRAPIASLGKGCTGRFFAPRVWSRGPSMLPCARDCTPGTASASGSPGPEGARGTKSASPRECRQRTLGENHSSAASMGSMSRVSA